MGRGFFCSAVGRKDSWSFGKVEEKVSRTLVVRWWFGAGILEILGVGDRKHEIY